MAHKFRIAHIRLNEAHFSIIRQFKWSKDKAVELRHSVEVRYKQATEKGLNVVISVASDSENQPFRFSVACEGVFAFEEMPAKEDLERIAHIHCASLIFPYVREFVADLTRRAGMPPLHLPPFNFVAVYEEKQKAASEEPPQKIRKKPRAQARPPA
jgi:preprotein translocase subunit SecB